MIGVIVVLLFLLWLLGYVQVPGLMIQDAVLFSLNGRPITVLNLLVFVLILWAIGILPSPFREIAGVLFVLWILSLLGFIALAGLSNLILIAIIVGIVASIVRR
jgi:hypothetical protein